MAYMLAFFGIFAAIVASVVFNGYVLSLLWSWHVVPVFGVRPLAIPEAIGLTVICVLLAKQYVPPKEGDHGVWAFMFIKPVICLLTGWVALKF